MRTAQILMAEHGGNANAASRVLGIPPSTIKSLPASSAALPPDSEQIRLLKAERAAMWDNIIQLATAKMPEKIEAASFRDLAWAAAVATDKWLLLTGNATSRAEHVVTLADYYRQSLEQPKRAKVVEMKAVEPTQT